MIETVESRVQNNQALLVSIVKKIHQRLPRFIPYEDVLSYGQLGLLQAAQTYQPQPDAKFSTYAYYRISGAIFDGVSRMNWSSRAEYRKYKAFQLASSTLNNESQTAEPSDSEQSAKWFSDSVENLSVVYLFSATDTDNPIENQLAGNEDEPAAIAEINELKTRLQQEVSTLSSEEQQLVQLAYFDGLSLAEASAQMGRSRSWGSRTHAKILAALKSKLVQPANSN